MRKRFTDEPGRYPTGSPDDTATEAFMRRTASETAAGETVATDLLVTQALRSQAAGMTSRGRGTTSVSGAAAVAGALGATEATAEIPVVRVSGARSRPPVELEDGTVWYPGVSRRLPAPFLLRLLVWLLFFAVLLGLAGLAVERWHPGWLSFLRQTTAGAPAQAALPGSGGSSSPGGQKGGAGSAGSGAGGLRLVSSNASTSTYSVPAASYHLVVSFPHRTWVRIASPAGSTHYVVAQTYPGSASPLRVSISGSADVYLGASTTSIAVVAGGHTLGTVKAPAVGHYYRFQPAG